MFFLKIDMGIILKDKYIEYNTIAFYFLLSKHFLKLLFTLEIVENIWFSNTFYVTFW